MIRHIFFLLFAFFSVSTPASADFLKALDTQDSYDLTDFIEYYKDDTDSMTLEDIQRLPESEWKRAKYTQYGFYQGRIWLRFSIDFTETRENWFISEKTSTFDSFNFYNLSANGYVKEEYGLFINKPYLFKSRSILIKPHFVSGKSVYFASVKTGTPMLFIFSLLNKSALNDTTFKESLLLGLYYGAALICLLFHLFIYFTLRTKEKVYLYYCLFVVSLAAMSFYIQGLRFKFFGPPLTSNDLGFNFDNPATSFSVVFGFATFSWYILAYYQLNLARYRWISRFFKGYVAALLVVFIPLLFVRDSAFMGLLSRMKMGFSLVVPFLAFYIYQKDRYQPALFFGLASTFTALGFLVYILTMWGEIKGSFFTAYSAIYFAIPEYTLIAFSLASRINHMRFDHEQKLNANILEITEARNCADRANQLKDEFLAASSHELKTPLNAIYGYMQVLQDTRLNPVQQNCVEGSIDQVEQLNKVVNDILDYAKIEQGVLSFDIQPTVPFDVIGSVVQSLANTSPKGVEIVSKVIDKGNVCDVAVGIDPVRFRQLAVNLISNALKFTDKGIVSIYLYCTLVKKGTIRYVLEVKDTGIGISKDQLDQIFKKFHQVSRGSDRQRDGIGLGLAIVKSISELFGGTIEVQSVPNVGSTFTFTFTANVYQPIVKRSPVDVVVHQNVASVNFLLVEDHAHNRTVFQYMVDSFKVNLDIAETVDDAIELYRRKPYSGVFVDLHMPGKDGYSFAHFVRGELGDFHTPLIAVSADTKPSTKIKCKDSGINDFIEKPIKKFVLHAKIKEIVKSHDAVKGILESMTDH